jgi:O-antigen ligase
MNARPRALELLPSSILALAAILGLLAVIEPLLALAGVVAIILAYVVFSDLAMGFAVLAFLSFLDTLPASSALSPSKALGLLVAVAWLARFTASGGEERDFFAGNARLAWILIAFFVWATITVLWSSDLGVAISSLTRYAPNLLLIPIAYTAIRTRRDLKLVLGAILLGAILAASFGLVAPPDPNLVEEGGRATGTVGDPNELAAFLLVGLAIGAGLVIGKQNSSRLRTMAGVAVPLCAGGIFLSLSRGGLVALAAALIAGPFFAGRWRGHIAILLVLLVSAGVLYFTQIASLPARERITAANGGTGRSDIWKLGLRMVRAHPIEGVGVGEFPVVSADYALQPGELQRADLIFSTAPKVTHNTYLEIMSEMGIPGFLLFMALLASCLGAMLKAARIWSRNHDPTMEVVARSAFLGLLGLLVADFFISDMYSKLLWVMLALGPVLLGLARSDREVAALVQPNAAREPVDA